MTVNEMTEAWRQAFRSPVPNISELKFVLDMQSFLEPLLPQSNRIELVTKPHQFIIRYEAEAEGPVKSCVTCKRWSDTTETKPTHILLRLPQEPPFIKAGRPLFFHRDSPSAEACEKRWDEFVDQLDNIFENYLLSPDIREDWEETLDWLRALQSSERRPFEDFWPLSPSELADHVEECAPLLRLPLAPRPDGLQEPIPEDLSSAARQAALLRTELEDHFEAQGMFVSGAGEGHRQVYDARRGNLVVLDNRDQVANGAGEDEFLGDWEQYVFVGYVIERLYPKDATAKEKRSNDPEELLFKMCEPWAVDEVTREPVMPLWLHAMTSSTFVSTAWEDVWHLPWKPVEALPVHVYESVYAKDYTNTSPQIHEANFMGSGIPAVVNLHLQSANKNRKELVVKQPFAQLQYTCMVDKEEKTTGALFPREAFDCIEKQMELVALKKGLRGTDASQTSV